jgi:hypothetical protein
VYDGRVDGHTAPVPVAFCVITCVTSPPLAGHDAELLPNTQSLFDTFLLVTFSITTTRIIKRANAPPDISATCFIYIIKYKKNQFKK